MNKHSKDFKPAGTLNIVSGFPASVLMHAEYNGLPCLMISVISDSHYVTEDTLKAFEAVTRELLGFDKLNFDKLSSLPGFKTALKDVNTRDNTIFT